MIDNFQQQLVGLVPRLRRFAYVLTNDKADADDLVQSACVRALQNRSAFRMGTRMDSWMYRIIQNLWIDNRRRLKTRGDELAVEDISVPDRSQGPAGNEAMLLLGQVRAEMARLPDSQRIALALVAIDGMSYREAADMLDVPIGTIMSRISRARATLVEHFGTGMM